MRSGWIFMTATKKQVSKFRKGTVNSVGSKKSKRGLQQITVCIFHLILLGWLNKDEISEACRETKSACHAMNFTNQTHKCAASMDKMIIHERWIGTADICGCLGMLYGSDHCIICEEFNQQKNFFAPLQDLRCSLWWRFKSKSSGLWYHVVLWQDTNIQRTMLPPLSGWNEFLNSLHHFFDTVLN